MSRDEFQNEKLYLSTMHYANVLLKKGTITKEQYTKINTIFANKYGTSLSTLCPQIHLK